MTFLLQKLFNFRTKIASHRGNPDREMPFLEHLEELRGTCFRIIITLVVAMIAAFLFHQHLFDLMRKPVEFAELGLAEENHLPDGIAKVDWLEAKRLATTAATLTEAQRAAFIEHAADGNEDLADTVEAALFFRAALSIQDEDRDRQQERRSAFIDALPAPDPEALARARLLVEAMPEAKLDRHGNLIEMTVLGPAEGFILSIKLSFFAGVVLSFPLLLFFGAQFILPGLTKKEKTVIIPFCLFGFLLFLIGVCFCYFIVAPKALAFFHGYNDKMGVQSDWRIGYYVGFVTKLTLGFGLCFQLPVVVMALVRLGLLDDRLMRRTRSYAVIIIVFIAALITPTPDALTLSFLAVPMMILYEISIWIAYFMCRRQRRREAEEEAEHALWLEKKRSEREEERQRLSAAAGSVPADGHDENGYAHDDYDTGIEDDFPEDNDYLRDRAEDPIEYEEGFEPRPADSAETDDDGARSDGDDGGETDGEADSKPSPGDDEPSPPAAAAGPEDPARPWEALGGGSEDDLDNDGENRSSRGENPGGEPGPSPGADDGAPGEGDTRPRPPEDHGQQ